MKRGLKVDWIAQAHVHPRMVTILAPMKRGLKEIITPNSLTLRRVTILAPMKRGLKDHVYSADSNPACTCYNPCPDEKGTESQELPRVFMDQMRELQSLPR